MVHMYNVYCKVPVIYTHMYMYIIMCVLLSEKFTRITYTYYIRVHNTLVNIYIYIYMFMYMYMYMYICVCIRIYVHGH